MGQRCGGTVCGGSHAGLVKQEGDGDQDTAADDERKHVGDTVHQVLVEDVGGAFFLCGACGFSDSAVHNRRFIVQDLVDQLIRLVDACGDVGLQDLLAAETVQFDLLVGRDDDTLGVADLIS